MADKPKPIAPGDLAKFLHEYLNPGSKDRHKKQWRREVLQMFAAGKPDSQHFPEWMIGIHLGGSEEEVKKLIDNGLIEHTAGHAKNDPRVRVKANAQKQLIEVLEHYQ